MTKIDTNLLFSTVQQSNREHKSDLGKDDFLKLLLTQLQNQDPLNPMEDKDFIAQMATFSSLEQLTNLNSNIEILVESQTQTNLLSYNQFIGKEITWHKLDETAPEDENKLIEGKGVVQSIQFIDNTVKITLEDGTELYPGNISEVHTTSKESPLTEASRLIGKEITWTVDDQNITDIVQSVSLKEGKVWLTTKNGHSVETQELTKIA